MRTTALILAIAFCGAATSVAVAQDKPKQTESEAAEDAFLKAYFSEKELKDHAAAEKAYDALLGRADLAHDAREVYARALVGRARCLRELKRDAEADALLVRVQKEFADVPQVADEAKAALARPAAGAAGFEGHLRAALATPDWGDEAPRYGDRAVPFLVQALRDDQPDLVRRAAGTLARIGTPKAVDALLAELLAGRSSYPAEARDASLPNLASDALRRLAQSDDGALRERALSELVYSRTDAPDEALLVICGDAALRAEFLGPDGTYDSVGYGRLLAVALASGGEARAAALERIRELVRRRASSRSSFEPLVDPPAAVFGDAEALKEIAALRWAQPGVVRAPDPFTEACLAHRATEKVGVSLAFAAASDGFRPANPDAFIDALSRTEFFPQAGRSDPPKFAGTLLKLLGERPTPERLRRVAAAWPPTSKGWFEPFVASLLARGVRDEVSLTAVHDAASAPGLRAEFLSALADGSPEAIGPWPAKLFSAEIEHPDAAVRKAAVAAMAKWRKATDVDLTPYAPALVASLDEAKGEAWQGALELLVQMGRPAVPHLVASLAKTWNTTHALEVLREIGDPSAADAVERVLRTSGTTSEIEAAARTLVTLKRDAAKDALAAAIVARGGENASVVLERGATATDDAGEPLLRPETRVALLKTAISVVPGRASLKEADYRLPATALRELAPAGLASSAASDRLWGATTEAELLDVGAWDALLACTRDPDSEVCEAAREALRKIRASETEMTEFRTISAERATRARIEKLLASEKEDDRRAGIAAIVATGIPGMVDELIRLAAEDFSPEARDDARRALLALAKAPAASPPAAPAKK